jgi:hypothetical protein
VGQRLSSRVRKLPWPVQGRPPNTEWKVWASHLDELEKYGRLIKPLGAWIAIPHQTWTEFMDGQSGNIYVISGEMVKHYQPFISNVRTRSEIQCWFDTTAGVATHLLPEGMVPATIDHSRTAGTLASTVFSLTYSGSWSFHNHITIYSRLNTVLCKAKYRVELYALWEAIHVLLTTEQELLASCGKNNFPAPEVTIALSQKRIIHRIFTRPP